VPLVTWFVPVYHATVLLFVTMPSPISKSLLVYAFAIVWAGLYLPFSTQIVFYLVAIAMWVGTTDGGEKTRPIFSRKWGTVSIIALLLLIAFIGLRPYLSGHPAPLGYDTGIYQHELEQSAERLPGFAVTIHPGMFFLSDALFTLGITPDQIMFPGYFICFLLLALSIYSVTKHFFGRDAAILALALFVFSEIQFTAYSYMLFKNMLGASVMLFSLVLISKRSWLLLPIGLFLVLLQPTQFLLVGVAMLIMWIGNIKNKNDRRFFGPIGVVVGVLGAMVLLKNPTLLSTAWNIVLKKDALAEGQFIEISQAIQYSMFYCAVALVALVKTLRVKKIEVLRIITLVTAGMVFLKLFFYHRYIIELDIFMLIFAGFGLSKFLEIIHHHKSYRNGALAAFILLAFVSATNAYLYKPFVSSQEFSKIRGFCETIEPNAVIMAADSYYAPWLHGYSCHTVFAPGIFEASRWSNAQWNIFWNGTKEERGKIMSETFPKDSIYIYIGKKQTQMNFEGEPNFSSLGDGLWVYNYSTTP
jgi:hypothetical protein